MARERQNHPRQAMGARAERAAEWVRWEAECGAGRGGLVRGVGGRGKHALPFALPAQSCAAAAHAHLVLKVLRLLIRVLSRAHDLLRLLSLLLRARRARRRAVPAGISAAHSSDPRRRRAQTFCARTFSPR